MSKTYKQEAFNSDNLFATTSFGGGGGGGGSRSSNSTRSRSPANRYEKSSSSDIDNKSINKDYTTLIFESDNRNEKGEKNCTYTVLDGEKKGNKITYNAGKSDIAACYPPVYSLNIPGSAVRETTLIVKDEYGLFESKPPSKLRKALENSN